MAITNPCLALIIAATVAGCAAAEPGFTPQSTKPSKFKALLSTETGTVGGDGRYILSSHEQKLDCKKVNGIIYLGILQLRESSERHRPSIAAKAANSAMSPVIGGSSYGLDVEADHARALARVEALNARLAEKKCPTSDLKAELAPGNTNDPAPMKTQKKR